MSETLKPCPFCGGEAKLLTLTDGEVKVYGIFCMSNLAGISQQEHFMDLYDDKQEAIAAWNRRMDECQKD